MRRRRNALFALGFLALLAVAAYLFAHTRAIGNDTQGQLLPALRALKQLDAEWDANILKSRVGLNNNYDPVTTPLKQVRALREQLVRGVRMSEGSRLEAALYKMETSFEAKEELVEQFKSQNALLHNSLRYFPTGVAEYEESLRTSLAATVSPARIRALHAGIDRLLTDVLRFHLMPESDLGTKIAAEIDTIDGAQQALPAALKEALDQLLRHARMILQQRVVEDELMKRVSDAPTATAIDELTDALNEEFNLLLRDRQVYRTYLVVYAGLLLLLLAYAAWRLMQSFQEIAQFNKRLQAANDTLEQRVAERTAELERQSAQLAELATHDTLTGLINRRHLMAQLELALLQAQRRGWVVVLMFIDLDGFKAVNDSFGHAAGDLLLCEAATRIKRLVRKEDAVARFGGDEFVVLLGDVASREGAERVAAAVLDALCTIREIDGMPVQISASIGISGVKCGEGIAPSQDALLNAADQAMYRAKQSGKNQYCFDSDCAWSVADSVRASA